MSTTTGTLRRVEPRGWNVPLIIAIVVVIAAIALIGFGGGVRFPVVGTTSTDTAATPHTLSITGTGRVFVTPDLGEVQLGVLVQRPTVAEASQAGAKAMTDVVAAVRTAGIPDADIQTSTLSLQPIYETKPEGGTQTIVGYQLRKLDLIGQVVDGAVAAGATTIDGITFRVADPTPMQRQAREAAVADARAKADTLVRAAGTRITGIMSISESTASPVWPSRGAATVEAAGTPVLPGTTEIDVTVSMTYLLE